jgi:hypothetical protein
LSPTSLPPETPRPREELLGIVRTRATVLRRRRRAAISGTMALVLAVLGGGVAISRSIDSGPSVQVTANQGETPTTAPAVTSSSLPEASPTTTTTVTKTTGKATTSTTVAARPVTTTTSTDASGSPECRQSTDPRCGPFRWVPEPTKNPLTVQVSLLTADPEAGKPLQFKVIVDELDTTIDKTCFDYSGTAIESRGCNPSRPGCPDDPAAYGPWSPPEKMPDHFEMTSSRTYDKPGTYTLSYTFRTGWPGCSPILQKDPYANSGTGSVTFTVRAPAEGTTSTTSPTTTSSSITTTTKPSGRIPG